jgi:hypothetical protein
LQLATISTPKAETLRLVLKGDSLKGILRQNKINELIGKWKWIPKEAIGQYEKII